MLRKLLLLLLCGVVSSSITCPDKENVCQDQETCCFTERGYKCCPYPNAVCCADQAHCCPFGYECDQTTQMCERRWNHRLLLLPKDEAPLRVKPTPLQEGQVPPSVDQALPSADQALPSADQALPSVDQAPPSVVYCDNVYTCPNGYTCCRHPAGGWTCCPYSPARCCLDGYHCCPSGFDCDYTYTHCIKQGVPYPFSSRHPSSRPADPVKGPVSASATGLPAQPAHPTIPPVGEKSDIIGGVIHCDSQFYCPKGSSCCKNQNKEWNCCPFPLGICCADGRHCCQYGYSCDATYNVCRGPVWNTLR